MDTLTSAHIWPKLDHLWRWPTKSRYYQNKHWKRQFTTKKRNILKPAHQRRDPGSPQRTLQQRVESVYEGQILIPVLPKVINRADLVVFTLALQLWGWVRQGWQARCSSEDAWSHCRVVMRFCLQEERNIRKTKKCQEIFREHYRLCLCCNRGNDLWLPIMLPKIKEMKAKMHTFKVFPISSLQSWEILMLTSHTRVEGPHAVLYKHCSSSLILQSSGLAQEIKAVCSPLLSHLAVSPVCKAEQE